MARLPSSVAAMDWSRTSKSRNSQGTMGEMSLASGVLRLRNSVRGTASSAAISGLEITTRHASRV